VNTRGRTAFVVVDFQGGPMDEQDPLVSPDFDQLTMRDKAIAMVAGCRETDVPVIWIQEVHKPHLTDIGRELDGAEGPHCLEGDPNNEIAHGLAPAPEEFHIRKRRYSAFFGTPMDIVLRSYDVDSLILIGGLTDICVLYTAVDAHQRDLSISVVTDCVAGSSLQAHDDALKAMEYLQRDALVTSEDVLAWLAERPAVPAISATLAAS
jgi:nicotinamidase-related amidase